ncbi:MAG: YceI family protein [Acidimicrobiia bacterium]
MNKKLLAVGGIAVAAVAAIAIWWFASTGIDNPVDVTAPPLAADTTVPAEATGDTATPDTPPSESTEPTDATAGASDGAVTYELGEESSVAFELDEELRGSPFRVVATNSEVAGQIRVDASDLSTAEVGTIVIGAQTFATESSNRDRAIRGPILDSNTFQTIQFVSTSIEGLSGPAAMDEAFEFTVTGDLTVRDITLPVTFTVSAVLTEGGLVGSAETTVLSSAYGLAIPSVPSVANVADEVLLRIEFVAPPA